MNQTVLCIASCFAPNCRAPKGRRTHVRYRNSRFANQATEATGFAAIDRRCAAQAIIGRLGAAMVVPPTATARTGAVAFRTRVPAGIRGAPADVVDPKGVSVAVSRDTEARRAAASSVACSPR
jgi:hypothetical protein